MKKKYIYILTRDKYVKILYMYHTITREAHKIMLVISVVKWPSKMSTVESINQSTRQKTACKALKTAFSVSKLLPFTAYAEVLHQKTHLLVFMP